MERLVRRGDGAADPRAVQKGAFRIRVLRSRVTCPLPRLGRGTRRVGGIGGTLRVRGRAMLSFSGQSIAVGLGSTVTVDVPEYGRCGRYPESCRMSAPCRWDAKSSVCSGIFWVFFLRGNIPACLACDECMHVQCCLCARTNQQCVRCRGRLLLRGVHPALPPRPAASSFSAARTQMAS